MTKKAKKDIFPVFLPQGGCKNNCVYCSQLHITGKHLLPDAAEIEADLLRLSDSERELAFYGGSFTSLPKTRIDEYLACGLSLKEAGKISAMRCSTHPNAIDEEIVALLQTHGMDRVELGVQSLDDDVLLAAGRGHGKADVFRSISLLHKAGIEVGVQLMQGLPLDSRAKSLTSVRELLPYRPDFVRLYPLLVLVGTPLARDYEAGDYQPLTLDEAVAWTRDLLAFFSYHDIPVIRIGLQPGGDIYRGSPAILAGPYHESFGNLTKAALKLEQIRMLLSEETAQNIRLLAPREDLPLLFGYQRQNIRRLHADYPGRQLTIGADGTLPKGAVALGSMKGKNRRDRLKVINNEDFLREYQQKLAGSHCI